MVRSVGALDAPGKGTGPTAADGENILSIL